MSSPAITGFLDLQTLDYMYIAGFYTEILLGGGGLTFPPLTDHTKGQFSDMLEDVQFEEVLEIF